MNADEKGTAAGGLVRFFQRAKDRVNGRGGRGRLLEEQARLLALSEKRLAEKDERIASLRKELARERKRAGWLDSAVFDGVIIPPKNLRPCGANFQDDEFYLASAKVEADKLIKYMGLGPESSLLDVGSGPGRLAIGILQRAGEIREYWGLDVDETSVRWGQHYITPAHPDFRFIHIDVENSRYNPSGSETYASFAFSFADGEFDIITLYSVFTHMLADGVRAYLEEFRRMLRPDGRIFLTAFLEEDAGVPDVTERTPKVTWAGSGRGRYTACGTTGASSRSSWTKMDSAWTGSIPTGRG